MPFYRPGDRSTPVPVLAQVGTRLFELCNGFRYRSDAHDATYVVPRDADDRIYDLASIPLALRWLVPTYGRHTLAALLHDDLVRASTTTAEREVADHVFRDALGELDVPLVRRWLLWGGTALGTLATSRGWLKVRFVAWAVLVVAASVVFWASVGGVALPVVDDAGLLWPATVMTIAGLVLLHDHVWVALLAVPSAIYLLIPAVVVGVALAVYGAVEWLACQVLRLINRVRSGDPMAVTPVMLRAGAGSVAGPQCRDALADTGTSGGGDGPA